MLCLAACLRGLGKNVHSACRWLEQSTDVRHIQLIDGAAEFCVPGASACGVCPLLREGRRKPQRRRRSPPSCVLRAALFLPRGVWCPLGGTRVARAATSSWRTDPSSSRRTASLTTWTSLRLKSGQRRLLSPDRCRHAAFSSARALPCARLPAESGLLAGRAQPVLPPHSPSCPCAPPHTAGLRPARPLPSLPVALTLRPCSHLPPFF